MNEVGGQTLRAYVPDRNKKYVHIEQGARKKKETIHVSECGFFLFFKQDRSVGVEACGISLAGQWMRIRGE